MKCRYCQHNSHLKISRSRNSWYIRLLGVQYIRCHNCQHSFLAPLWKSLPMPRSLTSGS